MKVMVINGPGTWFLGREDVKNSGNDTLNDIDLRVRERAEDYEIDVEFARTNYEGEIIDSLYLAMESYDGVILNIGGYAYSSYAIAEAISVMNIPVIEVIPIKSTVIEGRESLIAPYCTGRIIGLGSSVYTLALEALLEL